MPVLVVLVHDLCIVSVQLNLTVSVLVSLRIVRMVINPYTHNLPSSTLHTNCHQIQIHQSTLHTNCLRKARPPASAGVWGVHNKAEILQFLLKIGEEQAQFSFLITINSNHKGTCVQ